MAVREWRSTFVRGALPYAVLAVLSREEVHGYQLLVRLKESGFGHIVGGVLYPLLRRLEEDELVAHRWDTTVRGPARKVLRLTSKGRHELAEAQGAWRQVSASLARLTEGDA